MGLSPFTLFRSPGALTVRSTLPRSLLYLVETVRVLVAKGIGFRTQSVKFPDDQCIARPTMLEYLGQSRPLCLGATGCVRKNVLARNSHERAFLKIEVLVAGRNSSIVDKHEIRPFLKMARHMKPISYYKFDT